MSTGTQTPVTAIATGTRFIPTGKKQTVEALIVEDHGSYLLIGYLARHGFNVCSLLKTETVAVFA